MRKLRILKNKIKNYKEKILRTLKIYLAYFKIKFLNEIQYRAAAMAGIATQFVWAGMYMMLYTAFLKDGSASDFSVRQMATYIWLQQAFFSFFNVWSIDKEIEKQCENGDIATELVKPVSLYSIWHAKNLSKKTAMVTLRAVPILVISAMPFLGQYQLIAPKNFGLLIISITTMLLSVLLMLSFVMIMYGTIMKTITSNGIKAAFGLVIDFASGMLIPIPFMPDIIINILKFTPFYYMQNVTFNIYNGYINSAGEIVKILILQICWILLFTYIGKKIINKQISKVVVQGG